MCTTEGSRSRHAAWRGIVLSFVLLGSVGVPSAWAQRKLNGFVTEYLDVAPAKAGVHAFELPEKSWVFIRALGGKPSIHLRLDDLPAPVISYEGGEHGTREAMRYLAAGPHRVTLAGNGLGRLQVRTIPEIRYAAYQYDPWVIPYGPYDWAYLQKHILPHVTTVVGASQWPGLPGRRMEDQADRAVWWRAQGRRWLQEVMAPGLVPRRPVTAEDVVRDFSAGLARPWSDGLLVDEYGPAMRELFAPTLDAVRRLGAERRFSDKRLEFYVAGDPTKFAPFLQDAVQLGGGLTVELYLAEQRSEEAAREYLRARLVEHMKAYRQVIANPERHIVVALGIMSGPPESLNSRPDVNYRVFLDMQLELLANDPAFDGVAGVMGYTSGYAEEETLRWLGKLYRHYCIEGERRRLTDEPYLLDHLANPDFSQDATGWHIKPAEPGTVSTRPIKNLGFLQGRYVSGDAGDQCLVMARSEKGPNRVSQELKQLVPGALYALRMYSANLPHLERGYGNPTFDDVNTVGIDIEGAELMPEKAFQHVYRSIHTEGRMYFNYHFRLFRARDSTARLTISDWRAPETRFGNVGKETCINFVEVQRYLEPSGAE